MPESLHDDVRSQLRDLKLDKGRPLIITDADEVLLRFLEAFEDFLENHGLYLDLTSYALQGNVRHSEDDSALDWERLAGLIDDFFRSEIAKLAAVPGAREALDRLSRRAQIVIVTNIPLDRRKARIENLSAQGIRWPVIANVGAKGDIARVLSEKAGDAPAFFIDDAPRNLDSVAERAAHIHRVHYAAHPRLAELFRGAAKTDYQADDWDDLCAWIETKLDALGY